MFSTVSTPHSGSTIPGGSSSTSEIPPGSTSVPPSPSSGVSAGNDSRSSSTMGGGSPGTSSTSTTTTEMPLAPIPIPTRYPTRRPRVQISSEAAENTALVIGIIAGAMIAIILIILIILKFKNRSDGSYKVDESKNYQHSQGPNAALLGPGNGQQIPQQMNGNLKNGSDKCANKKRDVKDVKEWYV
ncbi:hypothetical protein C0J52_25920 [Blattella germanica]|nr:hypothetical protein C0J52_25920 [Blattella germanica]